MPIYILLLLYPLFWLFSIVPVWGVVVLSIFVLKAHHLPKSTLFYFMLTFLILQIAGVLLSPVVDSFQSYRLFPIAHNVLVFALIIVAMVWWGESAQDLYPFFRWYVIALFFLSAVLFYLHYQLGFSFRVAYPWGMVEFSRIGFLFGYSVPRVSLFAPYVNSLGLMALILFLIINYYWLLGRVGFKEAVAMGMMLLLVALFAGSRTGVMGLVLMIIFTALFRLGKKPMILGVLVVFLLMFSGYLSGGYGYLVELRGDSTTTRLHLYVQSIALMLENSPIWGLGQKPILPGQSIPIGSHSTYIGYFVKNGFVGLVMQLFFVVGFLYLCFDSFVQSSGKYMYQNILMAIILFAFAFEDIDAFELNAFLFGLALGQYFVIKNIYRRVVKWNANYVVE